MQPDFSTKHTARVKPSQYIAQHLYEQKRKSNCSSCSSQTSYLSGSKIFNAGHKISKIFKSHWTKQQNNGKITNGPTSPCNATAVEFCPKAKGCKSYDSSFSSIFHNFSQCFLDSEVSQVRVYFVQIGFVTLAKKSFPWSQRKYVNILA